jgi:hypothetical protein
MNGTNVEKGIIFLRKVCGCVPVYKTTRSEIAEQSESNINFHRYEKIRCHRLKVCEKGVLEVKT